MKCPAFNISGSIRAEKYRVDVNGPKGNEAVNPDLPIVWFLSLLLPLPLSLHVVVLPERQTYRVVLPAVSRNLLSPRRRTTVQAFTAPIGLVGSRGV